MPTNPYVKTFVRSIMYSINNATDPENLREDIDTDRGDIALLILQHISRSDRNHELASDVYDAIDLLLSTIEPGDLLGISEFHEETNA